MSKKDSERQTHSFITWYHSQRQMLLQFKQHRARLISPAWNSCFFFFNVMSLLPRSAFNHGAWVDICISLSEYGHTHALFHILIAHKCCLDRRRFCITSLSKRDHFKNSHALQTDLSLSFPPALHAFIYVFHLNQLFTIGFRRDEISEIRARNKFCE